MTTFAVTDIPATINSVEKLAVWANQVLNHLYPSVTFEENAGQSIRAAQCSPYEVAITSPPEYRFYGRLTFKLNRNWQQTGKLWEHALDLGSLGVPPAMRV